MVACVYIYNRNARPPQLSGAMQVKAVQPVTEINLEISKELGILIGAQHRRCFANAFEGLCALHSHRFNNETARYVEGWVYTSFLPLVIEHGWIEDVTDGRRVVIDPTPAYHTAQGTTHYYAGQTYSLREAETALSENALYLPLGGFLPLKNPLHAAAHHTAQRDCYPDKWEELRSMFGWPEVVD